MSISARVASDAREAERHATGLDGTLRNADLVPVDIRIEDLSSTGCRLSGASSLNVGDLVTIGVAGAGVRPARVVWSAGEKIACEFLVSLNAAELPAALSEPAVFVEFVNSTYALTCVEQQPRARAPKYPKIVVFPAAMAASAALWIPVLYAIRLIARA